MVPPRHRGPHPVAGPSGFAGPEPAAHLDRTGIACLPDAFTPSVIAAAQAEIHAMVAEHGRSNMTVHDVASRTDSVVGAIAADDRLLGMAEDLMGLSCPANEWPMRTTAVTTSLNITVTNDQPSPLRSLHYDASIVSFVVPLLIPDRGRGRSGELILFPNRRPFRRSVTRNVVDKMRGQSERTVTRLVDRLQRGVEGRSLALREGDAYVFWGYRTLHGNLPCAPNCVRATLTIHAGNPHGRHPLLRTLGGVNGIRHRSRVGLVT